MSALKKFTGQLPNQWDPRAFQLDPMRALDTGIKYGAGMHGGVLNALSVWHRRSGKDSCAINFTAKAAHERIGTYWHLLPQQKQARSAVWNAVDRQGRRLIDQAFPVELRKKTLEDEMLIQFKNGSFWQVRGGDNFDSLVGANPIGICLSEYALMSPRTIDYLSPITRENKGWIWANSTPRGNNHLKALYDINLNNPLWHVSLKTVVDTGLVTLAEIEEERRSGRPENIIRQEYFCDFTAANDGGIYDGIIQTLRKLDRIGHVPYDPRYPVTTAWDIGRDGTAIIFAQRTPQGLNIIDFYEEVQKQLPHFAKVIHSKPYNYATHIFPHDINVMEWGGDNTRIEMARAHGLHVTVAPKLNRDEGIEAGRALLQTARIDVGNCKHLIAAFEHYHREWDDDTKTYGKDPEHDWSSHPCDAWRYFSVTPAHYGVVASWANDFARPDPEWQQMRGRIGHNGGPPLNSGDYDPLDDWRPRA